MSDREDLHHADVEGADETVTVGAYRWIHTFGGTTVPGAPNITLWAGFTSSECGCITERLPAEIGLADYPRLLGNLLNALGEAARKAGPINLDLMSDSELDAHIEGLDHASKVLFAELALLAEQRPVAASEKARREEAANGQPPTAPEGTT